MIQVFNKILSGVDKESFLSLDKQEQKEWIKSNTNQSNDELIDQLLNSKTFGVNKCLNCGELNNVIVRHYEIVDNGNNIGKTDVIEASANSNGDLDKGSSEPDSSKRSKKAEGRKGKRI